MAEPAAPSFLRWSESAKTFDRTDHPESIPQLGRYPLMVDPIIGTKRVTKVLMDGGSNLNSMYAEMLDAMGIDQSCIWPTRAPFYGIMPRKQAMPLGQINLPVTFRNLTNYRTETLTFEVFGFHGTYHAILEFEDARSMWVITIGISFQHAYECEVECCEHATAIAASKELTAIREEVIEEAPDPKQSTGSFEPVEGAKEVLIDPSGSEGKVVHIGTMLSSK
ncbi:uncharacterized protein [Miscanthus floridulus]|uniref:uncharacterized protein n=1 Tax=Miscanthus floridulus TaxID=154761 RepID=UPI00345970DC